MIDAINNTTATTPAGSVSSIVPENQILGKDDFLKLLVTQLRTQDPLSPMDGQEMAVQLAQFSSVEQLMTLNEGIQAQAGKTDAMVGMLANTMGASLVGKQVLAYGDRVQLPADSQVRFEMDQPGTATLALIDTSGREVANQALGSLGAGRHTIDAAGLTQGLPPGDYRLQVYATDASGLNNVATQPLVQFVVDSLRFEDSGLLVTGGGVEVQLGDVVEMSTPPVVP